VIVLGIDQSFNSSGIVVMVNDNIIHCECFKSNKEKNRFGQAYEIAMYIGGVVDKFKPNVIGIEGIAFGTRGNILIDLSGLQYAIIICMQEIKKQKVQIIPPTTLKKFATGSGKASKQEMIDALPYDVLDKFLKMGYKKTTGISDLSDAFWICKYTEHMS